MTIQIKGLEELQRKLNRLEDFQKAMREPMENSLALLQGYAQAQPRKKKGAFTALATPKQKRAYWARVKAGEIQHGPNGYKRSRQLLNSWNFKIHNIPSGLRGEVGPDVPYARYVQSSTEQQPFHKASGWRTDEETIEKNRDKVQGFFDKAIKRELNR